MQRRALLLHFPCPRTSCSFPPSAPSFLLQGDSGIHHMLFNQQLNLWFDLCSSNFHHLSASSASNQAPFLAFTYTSLPLNKTSITLLFLQILHHFSLTAYLHPWTWSVIEPLWFSSSSLMFISTTPWNLISSSLRFPSLEGPPPATNQH